MKEFIEKLIGRLEEYKTKAYVTGFTNNIYEIGACHGMNSAIEIVNQLAEEYRQDLDKNSQGWIPCSDRLPETSGEYYTYVYYDGHYIYSIDEIDCGGIVKEWNCSSDYKILAWKPITPYQPKGE